MEHLRTLKTLFSTPKHWIPVGCLQPRYCCHSTKTGVTLGERRAALDRFKTQISSGPSFQDFIKGVSVKQTYVADGEDSDRHAYLSEDLEMGNSRKG